MPHKYTTVIPPAFFTEIGGGVGSILLHKEKHVDIVDTSDARPRGLLVFGEADIDNTNGKTEKTQYNNTKFMVLDSWRGVLLAAPGVRIGGGPPVAGGRSPCS